MIEIDRHRHRQRHTDMLTHRHRDKYKEMTRVTDRHRQTDKRQTKRETETCRRILLIILLLPTVLVTDSNCQPGPPSTDRVSAPPTLTLEEGPIKTNRDLQSDPPPPPPAPHPPANSLLRARHRQQLSAGAAVGRSCVLTANTDTRRCRHWCHHHCCHCHCHC